MSLRYFAASFFYPVASEKVLDKDGSLDFTPLLPDALPTQLHDIMIGLFVNRYEFGLAV